GRQGGGGWADRAGPRPSEGACPRNQHDPAQSDGHAEQPANRQRLVSRPDQTDETDKKRRGRVENGSEGAINGLLAECDERIRDRTGNATLDEQWGEEIPPRRHLAPSEEDDDP